MSFQQVKDVIVVVTAAEFAVAYVKSNSLFVYPVAAVLISVVWAALAWTGTRSAVTLGIVLLVTFAGVAWQAARRRPIFVTNVERPLRVVLTSMALFGAALLVGIILGVAG